MHLKFENQTKGYLMVALASVFWGTMGIYGQILFSSGITSKNIVFWKLIFAFSGIFVYTLIKDRNLLRIDRKGIMQFGLIGLICHALQNLFMLSAIEKTTIATATILLYTSPAFIIIISRIIYKEKLTFNKVISLVLCFSGSFLTVTGASLNMIKINVTGVMFGLGAGFTYSLVTILTKSLLKKYRQETIVLYSFGFGFLMSMIFSNPTAILKIDFSLKIWINLFLLGFVSTFASHFIYATGLSKGIESSKAGIIATLEIVVAVLISYFAFGEILTIWKLLGIIMVIASIVVLQIQNNLKLDISS